MAAEEFERVVTHTAVAKVARLMGYTPQGLIELCEACLIGEDWRVIGTTRPSLNKAIERVAARVSCSSRKLEFSVGNEAFALTANAAEAQRIRNEVADAVVKRISESRPAINPRFIRANDDRPAAGNDQAASALSSPETMIISPLAPRDPRGLEAAQRRQSGPGNAMSGHQL